MSISFRCETCKKQYNAPDQMSGKRIKCKACGTVLEIPKSQPAQEDELDLSLLSDLEPPKPARPQPKSRQVVAAPAPARMPRQREEFDAFEPESTWTPNVLWHFPLAGLVDAALPILMILGTLALVTLVSWSYLEVPQTWLAWLRAAIYLLAFFFVIVPTSARWLEWTGGRFGFDLPPTLKRRTAAILAPPFVLGYVLWLVGRGASDLVVGCILGLILASVMVWLVLRLHVKQLIPAYITAAVSYLLTAALIGGAMFGLNMLMVKIITSTGKSSALTASPFGQAFSWVAPSPPTTEPSTAHN